MTIMNNKTKRNNCKGALIICMIHPREMKYIFMMVQAREYKYVIQIVCLDMNLEIIVGEIKLANLS